MPLLKSAAPGFLYPFRHPKPQGAVESFLYGLGSVFRGVGVALDELGSMIQGPAGAVKEEAQPNLAWAPTKLDPSQPPTKGAAVPVGSDAARILKLKDIVMPVKANDVFIAANANVLGDVKVGSKSSIWYGAILRGDVNSIEVGSNTNIQDNVIVHVAKHSISGEARSTSIGSNVTIGHGATVHACTIGDNCLIGMGSTILDGAKVESGSIVAAGAIVTPGTVVKKGEIWAGNPAKKLRDLLPEEAAFIEKSASNYAELAQQHKFENSKCFEELLVESRIEKDRAALMDPSNSVHQMWEYDAQTALVTRAKR